MRARSGVWWKAFYLASAAWWLAQTPRWFFWFPKFVAIASPSLFMATPNFTIPLSPLERVLLTQIAAFASESVLQPEVDKTQAEIFAAWSWADLAAHALRDDLNAKTVAEDYNGDRNLAYRNYMHFMSHRGGLEQRLDRLNTLNCANPDFPSLLGDAPIEMAEIVPDPKDKAAWDTIYLMYRSGGLHWNHLTLQSARPTYDIFKSAYTYQLHNMQPGSFQHVHDHVLSYPSFTAIYEVEVAPKDSQNRSPGRVEASPSLGEKIQLRDKRNVSEEVCMFNIHLVILEKVKTLILKANGLKTTHIPIGTANTQTNL
jgi:hypothetical protein